MDKNILVLEYQENLSDNLSTYAYGRILESRYPYKCCYENSTDKRKHFEKNMGNFNLNYSYISISRAKEIGSKSKYMDLRDFRRTFHKKDSSISIPYFKISDINLINNELKSELKFKNTDFLKNYDILEEIINTNSVGIYISENDCPDIEYIKKSIIRINKYVKHPVLYVFSNNKIDIDNLIECKYCSLNDKNEEFYFLKSCKHKIIHCTQNSYSEGFWCSVLGNNNEFNYVIYSKEIKTKNRQTNWIPV